MTYPRNESGAAGNGTGTFGNASGGARQVDDTAPLDFARIKADAARHAEAICRRYLPDGKQEGHDWVALSPFRQDNKPGSFRVDLRNGTFTDFATHDHGDLIDIVRCVSRHGSGTDAARELARFLGTGTAGQVRQAKPTPPEEPPVLPVPEDAPPLPERHKDLGEPSARWRYADAEGRTLFYVCRFQTPTGKEDRPLSLRRTAHGVKWRWKGLPTPRPLYRLPELAAAPDLPVLVVEGEKSADAAARMLPGWAAVTSPGGSGGAGCADWQPLAGRRVVVWRDHDEPGERYAADVQRLTLAAGAASVALASLEPLAAMIGAPLPAKFDVADAAAESLDAAALDAWLRATLEATPADHAEEAPDPAEGAATEDHPADPADRLPCFRLATRCTSSP